MKYRSFVILIIYIDSLDSGVIIKFCPKCCAVGQSGKVPRINGTLKFLIRLQHSGI